MRYASVVLDIPTRALDAPFTYQVPEALASAARVGATVRVTFSRRPAVGYVIACGADAPVGVDPAKILPIEDVLAESAFDEGGAALAQWLSREYAANLSECVRLMLRPGQRHQMKKNDEGVWTLVDEGVGEVDDRWVMLTDEGREFKPRANAHRQLQLIEALRCAPQRMAELRVTMGEVSAVVRALEKRGVVTIVHRRRMRGTEATTLSSAVAVRYETLTKGQEQALAKIERAMEAGKGDVVLVDGVTGSGKTEVYLRAIEKAVEAGKGAIVLVPEISLTAQTVGRFRSRFFDSVAVLHSRLSAGERLDQWDLVRQGMAKVVVGARSALFSPLSDVGLIIIDEEHEGSYKQDKTPRYHAREAAAELARIRGCALVLGSATPSLESLERCRTGSFRGVRWMRTVMAERPGTATLPAVTVVDMAKAFQAGGRSLFSPQLTQALGEVADERQKAVLFLNRRGFATFIMCRNCGCVPECPHCSTSLTYHEHTHELVCHTCGSRWPFGAWPDPHARCPQCGSRYMGAYGVGTQRVVDELKMLLEPYEAAGKHVEVIRMDADTTARKGAHEKLLEQFDAAESAFLVGTQMIAKGLDFPEVTLVGVINADTMLKLPDFRSAERTYGLLEQVAGRAGRGEVAGRVIVQTYWANHPAIQAAATHRRDIWLAPELDERYSMGYPPFVRVSNVLVWGKWESAVRATAQSVADEIRGETEGWDGWSVLGPAECIHAKVKDNVRRHIVVKCPVEGLAGEVLGACVKRAKVARGVSIAVDVDAHDLM